MKTSTTLLAALCTALAIIAIHFGRELATVRASLEEATRLVQFLSSRAAQSAPPAAPSPANYLVPVSRPSGMAREPGDVAIVPAEAGVETSARRPSSPEAHRYLEAEYRASTRRNYADFAAEYGLTPTETSALYDLIARDELEARTAESADPASPESELARWRERERVRREKAAALLGAARAARLSEYEQTLPTRLAIGEVSEQLAGLDMPLSDDQRRRFISAAIKDGEAFAGATLRAGQSDEEMRREYEDQIQARAERLSGAARSILTPAQMRYYEDMRAAQRELRGAGGL